MVFDCFVEHREGADWVVSVPVVFISGEEVVAKLPPASDDFESAKVKTQCECRTLIQGCVVWISPGPSQT